ncbi:MAG: glycosyltransferase family 9 protein, partial [Calditrichaeota bacterium]
NRYPNPPLSVAEKYLRAASPLGLDTQDLQPELHLSSEIKSRMGEIYSDLGKQHFKVIIAPGARHFTKRWLPEYFQKLIILIHEQMGWKTILVGDKSEKDWIARIQEGVPHGIVQDFSGELTLEETCGLISSAPYFISNDSGLMHAAAAFRKPQVAIFGGTVRELGFFPINPQAVVVENSGLNCRPCSHIGRPNCPKHHFKCMKEITPQQVFQQFQRLVLKK